MLIRAAKDEDSLDILDWRNDPVTRSMFHDGSIIDLDTHTIWFKDAVKSKECEIMMGLVEGRQIGVCIFWFNGELNSAKISINLNPKERGKGLSQIFLTKSINKYLRLRKVDLICRNKYYISI